MEKNDDKIKVMVADDDIYVRQAMEFLMRRHPKIAPMLFASSIYEIWKMLKKAKTPPDVIVLDINFQGTRVTGIDAIEEIKELSPKSKILICSMNIDKGNVMAAIKAGADGFIWKNESGESIIKAVIRLVEGRFVVTQSVAKEMLGQAVELREYVEVLDRNEHKELTESLRKTLYLYCYCGMSAKEISEELSISAHTVNSRIKAAYSLLHATNRSEAFSKLLESEN
jgi:DNA-binding NarL/FixJ family response regulator